MFNMDGLALGELHVTFIGSPGTTMEAKIAFIDSKMGNTCGWTKQSHFSPKTMALLEELKTSIEEDAATRYAGGSASVSSGKKLVNEQGKGVTPSAEGLGELLGSGEDGVNQV